MTATSPQRITLDHNSQKLTINWADGHISIYPLDGLRRVCPCAACRGGHEHMGQLPDIDILRVPGLMQWNDVKLTPAGNYALQITWDDGHDMGMYTWPYLRAICPCNVCEAM